MNIEEARQSLPWYAVGALSSEEAVAVEARLAESPQLRRELEELRALHDVVTEQSANEPTLHPSSIANVWQRIDEYEQSRQKARSWNRSSPLGKLSGRLRSSWSELSMTGRWALAAQFLLILALGAVILTPRPESPQYQTASGKSIPTPLAGARFTVAFQPTATEAQIRTLLVELGAQVVAGPTAEQLYTVQLADPAAAAKALARLRTSSIVRFAAPEGE